MAYRNEKNGQDNDIVIDGWEKGIADSPELGLASIQGANITSVPGEVSTSFGMTASMVPPTGQSSVAFTGTASNDTYTVASTAGYYNGMAITLLTQSFTPSVSSLVVGGGGGGGGDLNAQPGGGGGGQVVSTSSAAILPGAFPIVVGAGGAGGGGTQSAGSDGASSTFNGITAIGGGGGGAFNNSGAGRSGASGGGGAGAINGADGTGGAGTAGFAGGNGDGNNPNPNAGGGGGGAGAVGTNGSAGVAGNGGVGVASSISGASVTYAGGGGAGGNVSNGTGGAGGGGNRGVPGTANTGGGGGGTAGGDASTATGGSGIVMVSYPTGTLTATGGSITVVGGNTIHTFNTSGTFTVTAINPVLNKIYYIGNLTSTTFKLYHDIGLTSLVDVITDYTGTFSIPAMTTPVWSTYYQYYASVTSVALLMTFIIDNTGNCWYITTSASTATGGTIAANTVQYTGNTGHATTGTGADFGVVVFKNYLFVIVGKTIDYISIANFLSATGPYVNWVYAWKTNLEYTQYQHQSIVGLDGAVYICNANTVASIVLTNSGTFDPATGGTYTYNTAALTLPSYDYAQSLAQLGPDLLVGGILNYIYPWDRVSTSFTYPLVCADFNMVRIVSTNSNAYVFAGNRGRIYITNGQQIQLYKKIPDSLTGDPEPYYIWQDAMYVRNKLYFTVTATNNASSTLNTMGGIWALGIDAGQTATDLPTAGSLFNSNQFSYGSYGGSCPVLFYSQLASPPGYGIGGAWVSSGVTGVDTSSTTPYTNYQTIIQTDIIPIGTYFDPITDQQMEYKLSKPLVAGEKVRISWRGNLTDSFTQVWESTTTGQLSDAKQVNFQKQQWVQFKIELSSTATTPSYARLREIRIR